MNRYILMSIMLIASPYLAKSQHKFTIDLNDISDDQFKVTLIPDELSRQNDIFQFAAIAPGTYSIMDIGRFVRSFTAFDANGDTLNSQQISTNQWKLAFPEKTKRIQYAIAETWDTPVKEHAIYPMSGTSLEEDHAYINNHAVLGYFHGMQAHELWIKIKHPEDWVTGTPLTQNSAGYFTAASYDFAVDSPFILGRLSKATTNVEGTQVDVFTYSKTDLIKSKDILEDLQDILFAASKFTNGLPVDRYVFLYHFDEIDYGAWEHSYSSNYALKESPLTDQRTQMFRSVAAHEFYHVVTPLNIHSALVEHFNFETPELSKHLWLYEGVTEWAAKSLMVKDELYTIEEYLDELSLKLRTSEAYDPNISLTKLGVNAVELSDQFGNVYMKGALTATMLDLLLLKKSKGKRGLRDLVNELAKKYGPNKPFDEELFFDELVESTYPEVSEFITRYIEGTEQLPLKEYFEFVGVQYEEFAGYDSSKVALGFGVSVDNNNIVISKGSSDKKFEKGDIIKEIDGEEISLKNVNEQFGKLISKKPGDIALFQLQRGNDTIDVEWKLSPRVIKHKLMLEDKPKRKQQKLQDYWLTYG